MKLTKNIPSWQDKVGTYVVLEMSTVCNFSIISETEFLHNCQQGVVNNWKNIFNVVCERPLNNFSSLFLEKWDDEISNLEFADL